VMMEEDVILTIERYFAIILHGMGITYERACLLMKL